MKTQLTDEGYDISKMEQSSIIELYENQGLWLLKEGYDISSMEINDLMKLFENYGLCTMKAKGIPSKCLKQDFYEDKEGHVVEFDGLKKVHKRVTSKQKTDGVSNFSIINNHQSRTFNKSTWSGFDLRDGKFYPKNYNHPVIV